MYLIYIYRTYLLQNESPKCNQIWIQLRFIHNWMIINIQWMVPPYLLMPNLYKEPSNRLAMLITFWNMDSTLVFDSSCVVTWWWILWKIGSRWWWNPCKHHWTKHPSQEFFFWSICCGHNKSMSTTFCQNNRSWDIVFFVMWSLQIGIF
jgi:hypothetical protein